MKSPQNAFKRFSTRSPATIAIVGALATLLLVVVVLFSSTGNRRKNSVCV